MKTEFVKLLGLAVKETRLKKSLSRERAGMAPSYLFRIESGTCCPNFYTFWKMCRTLDCKPSKLARLIYRKMTSRTTSYHSIRGLKAEAILKQGMNRGRNRKTI